MIAEALMTKPATDEYASYYGKYIDLVPEGSIIGTLGSQIADTLDLLSGLTEEQANYRYSPDKWSVKEIVGHLVDGERVFAYRAMRFARNDRTPLSGFEQDDYVVNGVRALAWIIAGHKRHHKEIIRTRYLK